MRPQQVFIHPDFELPDTMDIERQVLADIVVSPDVMGEVYPMIHRDFFTNDFRRGIWDTIADRYNRGEAFDMATLHGMIGRPFIEEVIPKTNSAGGTIDTISHATTLRNGATRRRAYIAATAYLQRTTSPAAGEADILAGLEDLTAQVEGPAPLNLEKSAADIVHVVGATAKGIEDAIKDGRRLRISTGFRFMDDVLNGGFRPGQLVVLAARPGVGKTSMMLHFAKSAASDGFPVYICSLEMTDEELGEKLVFSTGKVRPHEITGGRVDWAKFREASNEIGKLPIQVNTFSRTLDEIVGRITQAAKRGRCRFAMVDYLGLIRDGLMVGRDGNQNLALEKITTTLKAVAKRLGITIMLLAQLNRENVREKHSPELFNLRGSGSIEQDADIVFMLEYNKKRRCIIAWLRKSRNGKHKDENGDDFGFPLYPDETYSSFGEGAPEADTDLPPCPRSQLLPPPPPGRAKAAEPDDTLPF